MQEKRRGACLGALHVKRVLLQGGARGGQREFNQGAGTQGQEHTWQRREARRKQKHWVPACPDALLYNLVAVSPCDLMIPPILGKGHFLRLTPYGL